MSNCLDDIRSIGISCEAENQVGGVDKRIWLTQKGQISSYTKDVNGYVNTITMAANGSTTYKLATITSKKNKNSGAIEGVVGDNVNLVKHTVIFKIYPENPAQKIAIEKLVNADEMVAFLQTENGQILVYGLDKGMEMSALAGGTGTALQDDTSITFTAAGDQTTLPDYFLVTDLAGSIAYLNAISAPVA
jgi:hypothetical protein